MPEETELETSELQEAIDELHQDREERAEEEKRSKWTRYVGLATAIFAVFAALGALESGNLVNEAMIEQLKSSDKWNEYQADKVKAHGYGLWANQLVDSGAVADRSSKKTKKGQPLSPGKRLGEYLDQIEKEDSKTVGLSKDADELSKKSEALLVKHHQFAFSVTGIQVAIALGAVAALTKMKWVWFVSLVFGVAGVVLFLRGWV